VVGLSQVASSVQVAHLPMLSQTFVVFECLAEAQPEWPPMLFVDPVLLDAGIDPNVFTISKSIQ